jgi:TolB-like protein/truncated hemoglobin YjbI
MSSGSRRAMQDVVGEASIAVLPFTNMSADPENEFFADGLTQEIVNALTQFEELRVAARRSTIAFKGSHVDLRVVGERLKVRTVLEGSVHKSANRIRIYAQLINVSDGYHLWSERYDRELSDVFEVQDDISRAIANRLKVDLFSLIGGRQTVLAASDSFFRRIVADNSINHFFAGTDLAHLLAHYKMFISALLGGPEPYTGQDIGAAHAHLCPQLNDSHFDAFLKHFRAALQEVGVRDDPAERVMRVLEGKRNVALNRDTAIMQSSCPKGIHRSP